MGSAYIFVIVCGLLALAYGVLTSRSVLAADAGNARMQEISGAVQIGASAYLNRQYRTIAIVGVVILIILLITLGWRVAIGYFIGSVLSGAAGYLGMNVSGPISSARSRPGSPRTTRATRRSSPTMSATMSAIAPAWRRICSRPMS